MTDQKRHFWRTSISKFFLAPKCSLDLGDPFSEFQRCSLIRSQRKRRGSNVHFDLPGGAVSGCCTSVTRNRRTCQTSESRVAVAHVLILTTIVRSWLIDKQAKRCSLLKFLFMLFVNLPSPGLWLAIVVAMFLMLSLQINVNCPCLTSCAYASWPTKRTVTERAGAVVQLKGQAKHPFSP